jgi:zinc transport system permease protein
LLGFTVTAPVGMVLQRRRLARMPFEMAAPPQEMVVEESHHHEHGPGCGHVAIEHGDHVDYIHDGHRHAVHGGHYDEH